MLVHPIGVLSHVKLLDAQITRFRVGSVLQQFLGRFLGRKVPVKVIRMVPDDCLEYKTLPPKSDADISTQESQVSNRNQILNDKQRTSNKRTLDTSSLETSVRASTLKGKVCKPFWNERSLAWSQRLLSCTETDFSKGAVSKQ